MPAPALPLRQPLIASPQEGRHVATSLATQFALFTVVVNILGCLIVDQLLPSPARKAPPAVIAIEGDAGDDEPEVDEAPPPRLARYGISRFERP
jgi:hypothetical protein